MKVFWDTNLFIYLIERNPTFHPKVLALYRELCKQGHRLVTSTLTLGELIAQPLRKGRTDLVQAYTKVLTDAAAVELVDFTVNAAQHYGRIRAATALRQPDALQLACAAASGASTFITNDQRLWAVSVPGVAEVRGL